MWGVVMNCDGGGATPTSALTGVFWLQTGRTPVVSGPENRPHPIKQQRPNLSVCCSPKARSANPQEAVSSGLPRDGIPGETSKAWA